MFSLQQKLLLIRSPRPDPLRQGGLWLLDLSISYLLLQEGQLLVLVIHVFRAKIGLWDVTHVDFLGPVFGRFVGVVLIGWWRVDPDLGFDEGWVTDNSIHHLRRVTLSLFALLLFRIRLLVLRRMAFLHFLDQEQ